MASCAAYGAIRRIGQTLGMRGCVGKSLIIGEGGAREGPASPRQGNGNRIFRIRNPGETARIDMYALSMHIDELNLLGLSAAL